jgi:hypothetical protein
MFKKHDKQYVEAHDKLDGETRIYMTDGHWYMINVKH